MSEQPAFPTTGMTLRDYLASRAMTGVLSSWPNDQSLPQTKEGLLNLARSAYAMADAMLEVRGDDE